MPPQAIKAKRRGGGGSKGGGGRSSSSSSSGSSKGSTSSAPKSAPVASPPKTIPAPRPKSAPASPPVSKSPPLIVPPIAIPPESPREKTDKEKSGKKNPSLPKIPKIPKGSKPKHHDHHEHDSTNGHNGNNKALPGSPGPRGRDIGIALGVIFGVIIIAVMICVCCKRWPRRVTERKKSSTSPADDIELETQSAANEPEKPKRAFLKGGCAENIVTMRKQLGCMIPRAKSKKRNNKLSCLEEGLAGEVDTSRGRDSHAREEPVVETKECAGGRTGNGGLPAYIEEDGVGHCKDPENPCKKNKVPHICVEWPSEK